MTRDLAAVVLAAGAGTRLRPLTELRPKALCPVGNVALVDHAIARARAFSDAIAVNVSHGRALLETHLGARVHVSVEEREPLGTAGALVRLRDWIDGRDLVVLNADAWLATGAEAPMLGWDRERLRLLVVEDPARADFGTLRFAGISLLPWRAIAELPSSAYGLYEACWKPAIASGEVEMARAAGAFVDCGTPRDYHAANMLWSAGANVVGPGARVEGEIERTVVWPGAVVERGERLRDAVRADGGITVVVA